MSFGEALGLVSVALFGGAVAAFVTAVATIKVNAENRRAGDQRWRDERDRDDRLRFIDLKRERYAEFLRQAGELLVQLNIQREAVERAVESEARADAIPLVEHPHAVSFLQQEISLLSPDVGGHAEGVFSCLDGLYHQLESTRTRLGRDLGTSHDGRSGAEVDFDKLDAARDTFFHRRDEYLEAARRDLSLAPEP